MEPMAIYKTTFKEIFKTTILLSFTFGMIFYCVYLATGLV